MPSGELTACVWIALRRPRVPSLLRQAAVGCIAVGCAVAVALAGAVAGPIARAAAGPTARAPSGPIAHAAAVAPAAGAAAPPSATAAPVRVLRTAHGRVSYRVVGHGRPLVLIMGLGGSIDVWPPGFLDALARHHRVIAFDNEGIGASTLRRGRLTISRMGDDTAAVIAALHLHRPDVLGWSMGGFIAQSFAARHPGDYRRLVLSATAPGNGHAVQPSPAVTKVLAGGALAGILQYLFPPDQAGEARSFAAAISQYPHFYAAPAAILQLQLAASGRWFAGQEPSGHHDRQILAPTLVGAGVEDAMIPSANSTKLGHLIPHARVTLYPDAGHGFIFQDESSWAARINRFLR